VDWSNLSCPPKPKGPLDSVWYRQSLDFCLQAPRPPPNFSGPVSALLISLPIPPESVNPSILWLTLPRLSLQPNPPPDYEQKPEYSHFSPASGLVPQVQWFFPLLKKRVGRILTEPVVLQYYSYHVRSRQKVQGNVTLQA